MPPFGPKNPEFSAVSPERQRIRREIAEADAVATAIVEEILPHTGKGYKQYRATPAVLIEDPTANGEVKYTRAWAERYGNSPFHATRICTDSVKLDDKGNPVSENVDGVVRAKVVGDRIMLPNGLPHWEPEHQLVHAKLAVDILRAIHGEVITQRLASAK